MFWLILAVLAWGILHSLLAALKVKELILGWFGETLGRFYRLAYNVVAGLSFLPILVMAAVFPDRKLYSLSLPWSALMVIGEILALVVLVMGFRQTDALGVSWPTPVGKWHLEWASR